MKPINLTMSAFGSYSGVERIDFTGIQNGRKHDAQSVCRFRDRHLCGVSVSVPGSGIYRPKKSGIPTSFQTKECGRDNKVCQRDCKDQPDSSGWK